jgi:hypothetical protein
MNYRLPMSEEFRDPKKKRVIKKICPYRVKITPLGIGDFKEGDDSITYRRKDTVWYKANSEAKPEILFYKGLAIWFYHEFVSDIKVNQKRFRVFYNPIAKKFFANEFVRVSGKLYLKNPCVDDITVKKLLEDLEKCPKNKRLASIRKAERELIKKERQEKIKRLQNPVGRPDKENLKRATIWCITALDNKDYKNYSETIKEAYKVHGDKEIPLKSFSRTVRLKIKTITDLYKEKSQTYRSKNTRTIFAEKYFITKATVKSNQKQKK